MRWEEQQRLFSDFETKDNMKNVNSLEGQSAIPMMNSTSTRLKVDAGSAEAEITL